VTSSSGNIVLQSLTTFPGTIWKTLAEVKSKILFIESRDSVKKTVTFSAFDLEKNTLLWRDVEFEEKWWISLGFAHDDILMLTVYTDTNNPDKKSVLAFDVQNQSLRWWKNNFVVAYVVDSVVVGQDTKFGSKEVIIDVNTGNEVTGVSKENVIAQNFDIIRPLQYLQGTDHFETVKDFVARKTSIVASQAIEYCEHKGIIVISAFTGESELANYLIVFNSEGGLLLKEQLGENLKGIAFDTFFVLADALIFVKNKSELVSYKIV
jgi:hypothetical protein